MQSSGTVFFFFCTGRTVFPRDPEVAARQETGHGVARQVVDPALLAQLRHDGVDPREARLALDRNAKLKIRTRGHVQAYGRGFSFPLPGGASIDKVALPIRA